ncbi:MAG: flagellar biosynthetic protein FliO [bacterium]
MKKPFPPRAGGAQGGGCTYRFLKWAAFVLLLLLILVPVQSQDLQDPNEATASPLSATESEVRSGTPAVAVDPQMQAIYQGYDDTSRETPVDRQALESDMRSDDEGLWGTRFLWLAVFILLIVGCGWMMRRFLGGKINPPRGQIQVIASCPLSQRSRLFVVEVGNERFLIGEGGGNVSFISRLSSSPVPVEMPSVEEDRPEERTGSSFADRLREWEHSTSGQNVSGEVKTSLRLLETLTRRLRRSSEPDR